MALASQEARGVQVRRVGLQGIYAAGGDVVTSGREE